MYDGLEKSNTTLSYPKTSDAPYDIITGHLVIIDEFKTVKFATGEDGVENKILIKVVRENKQSEDLSDNYEFIYQYGRLKVLKREITIRTATSSIVYNGLDYSDVGYSDLGIPYSIASTDKLEVVKSTVVNDVCQNVKNEFKEYYFYNNGENATDSYIVNFEYGTLSISKREISITANSKSKQYDGEYLT